MSPFIHTSIHTQGLTPNRLILQVQARHILSLYLENVAVHGNARANDCGNAERGIV